MKKPELFLNDIHGGFSIIHLGFKGEEIVDNNAKVFVLFDYRKSMDFLWVYLFFIVSVSKNDDGGLVIVYLKSEFLTDFVESGNGEIKSELAFTITDYIIG